MAARHGLPRLASAEIAQRTELRMAVSLPPATAQNHLPPHRANPILGNPLELLNPGLHRSLNAPLSPNRVGWYICLFKLDGVDTPSDSPARLHSNILTKKIHRLIFTVARPKKTEHFQIKPFNNSAGSQSWRVTGTKPGGTRVRQNHSEKSAAL